MREDEQTDHPEELGPQSLETGGAETACGDDAAASPPPSLTDELATLIDDGRTYAEAELAFQKTRASLAGRKIGGAVGFIVLAVLLVHLVLVALVVGLLIALTPPFGIWGSIGIVVGGLLLLVVLTVLLARSSAKGVGELFKDEDT